MSDEDRAPDRIWLQRATPHRLEWTWHWEPIGEDDMEETEYVRADLTLLQPEGELVAEKPQEIHNRRGFCGDPGCICMDYWPTVTQEIVRSTYAAPPAPETREREAMEGKVAVIWGMTGSNHIHLDADGPMLRPGAIVEVLVPADAILGSEEE